MELKDGYIGKIIKDNKDIPCIIVGLALNCSKVVIFKVEYPTTSILHENAIKLMQIDESTSDITNTCLRNEKLHIAIHPSLCSEL